MSFLSNSRIFSDGPFRKYLGITVDPIKNAINPIINVITKLVDGAVIDKSKNNENKN